MCITPDPPPPSPPSPPPAPMGTEPTAAPVGGEPGEGARSRRRARVQASGRRSTLMTGPTGVMNEANIGRTTLLGG